MLILFFLFLEIIYLALASVYNRLLDKYDAKMYLLENSYIHFLLETIHFDLNRLLVKGSIIVIDHVPNNLCSNVFVIVPINVVNKEVVNVIRVISCFS